MSWYTLLYDVHYSDGQVVQVALHLPRNPPPPIHEQVIELASRMTGRMDAVKVTLPCRTNAVMWQRQPLRIFRGEDET